MTALPAVLQQTEFLGVHLVGVNAETGRKLLLTVALLVFVAVASALLGRIPDRMLHRWPRFGFWARQALRILAAVVLVTGIVSIWFDDPGRLATVVGLVSAGVAIALQRVITAFAGYLIILRGKQFGIGDRITIGGVRGDVVALDFMQTTVMEMGQAPGEQADDPSVWVQARQYTGRLVRVTNDRIFESPLYNYTRQFPFIWEEIRLPIRYTADRRRAEEIMLDVTREHTAPVVERAEPARDALARRFVLPGTVEIEPRSYMRLTDNWIELTVRFLVPVHGIRQLRSDISRDILARFDEAKIEIASATFEIVGMPDLQVRADVVRDA